MIYEIKHELLGVPIAPQKGVAKDTAIVKNQPVFADVSDGDIDGCASDAVKVIGLATMASTDCTLTAEDFAYTPVDGSTLILCDWTKSTAYAATDRGLFYAMTITSGVLTIDLDDTSHDAVQLVKNLSEHQATAGTSGRAWFRFISTVRQYDAIEVA